MPEGPLGGPRPFANDNKKVLVLIGIDGTEPPRDVLISAEELVRTKLNSLVEQNFTVTLTTNDIPTEQQRQAVGPNILHVQQYEITTEMEEISQGVINAIHNEVVDVIQENQFNVTGTKTTVV